MTTQIGIIQGSFTQVEKENIQKVISFLEDAHKLGANVVLVPELFSGPYFCKTQDERNFALAHEVENHPWLPLMQKTAKKLNLVVPCSFFEKSGPHFFNSLAVIDADGAILGVYRKSHLPDGPGYQEKFYFRPGNTGFKVFKTKFLKLGAGICWDQWFPECARCLTLMGADMLFYPTAIGSEPHAPHLSTKEAWVRVMKGHAVANMIPIAAANRIGNEAEQIFYGNSFICDEFGDELVRLNSDDEKIHVVAVDVEKAKKHRASFGFFRDRRVDLYTQLLE